MVLSVSLQHAYDGFEMDVSFEAPEGVTVLFGRSGSGKSTIINAVAGLLRPDQGQISVHGRVLLDNNEGVFVQPAERRMGVVFQEGRLFPHLTVGQNLDYGRRFASVRRKGADRFRLGSKGSPTPDRDQIIAMLGIGDLLGRRPATLSGGEKQRVAIGRALLADPEMILADEPLAALDETRRQEILPYFERLAQEVSVPILYVSHSPGEVARLATTVVALEHGKVLLQGSAEEVLSSPMVMPLGVRSAGAILEARVLRHDEDGLSALDAGGETLFLPRVSATPGTALRVRVAAQDVILSKARPQGLSALNILSGKVDTIRMGDGPGALVTVKTGAGIVLARVTRRSIGALDLKPGDHCHAIMKTVAIAPEDVGGG